ncbi:Asp-tRNA(Asn)/Glu-tRNA(Gln) amidotransferase subunit GatB [Ruminiclostridium cellulolyticum]|uniref:Aspartyl/glutamyl-tRNA(Asn/Gln) amidotransferase subunit B n=1 Tax=Ruminiclostridium cellulolyticum (strain ATCC 35319 / DSM 5812 / JCM 6584 / H10) TaxID=394503 RepID=GATB_RUMCH|nr:Asp-tRNA(Asn)/Glu-tRNA(Gln) amidotransferase subunit GatB [Ruminiclostridium cellulolyticum]B8I602.1 RecName: Full=Aspartyl/glutamyl-tRNA(Asn/Gln) amidotransferase subunit B; Short=Asp/Glu-ADT subunit B [Ruminiclostridium cellulolyticum H10]ACL76767.1 glutamyl-tRNA(Gln) amidotransferase, B subunit [Ruminiclostridium cellulolyticum H10]
MKYIPSIGLEIHSELSTKSKIFCDCPVSFGGEPNTRCCPVCTGMPGTLPVLNKQAVEYTVIAGLALNCKINEFSKMDRKNYFYPDLPKAYQISQFDLPICKDGGLTINTPDGEKFIRIERIHLEEDAGKLLHDNYDRYSLADYNRCGVPLIEIVTKPDLSSAEEAKEFVEKVRLMLLYSGVSDCRMEEGSLRADVNVSIRPIGTDELGTRTEMKNINSIKAIARAIDYEINRQSELLNEGKKIIQETRRWDDSKGESKALRSKEDAHDYRYFPEPDIVPVTFKSEDIEKLRKSLPELPDKRFERYTKTYSVNQADANLLLTSVSLSDFFEAAAAESGNPKQAANFIVVEVLRRLKDSNMSPEDIPFDGKLLARLLRLMDSEKITPNNAKKVLSEMFETGKEPDTIVDERGYKIINDTAEVESMVKEIISSNEKAVGEYLEGKEKTFGYLMGQCSRALAGRGNPKVVQEILRSELNKLRDIDINVH